MLLDQQRRHDLDLDVPPFRTWGWNSRYTTTQHPYTRERFIWPVTKANPRGAWVTSAYLVKRRQRVHRIEAARAVWEKKLRCEATTKCGAYLLTVHFHIEPPDDIDLCVRCLIDEYDVVHTVYQLRDDAGGLLYVGYSSDLPTRYTVHTRTSPFRELIADMTYVVYPTAEEALAAEREAIKTLRPRFNGTHNT